MKELNLFPARDNGLVTVYNNQVVTTSLQVSDFFQRQHKDVLNSIRNLECSSELREQNFSLSFYTRPLPNGGSKKEPMYYIGKDGFTFLAMGFTGKIAARFKEAYINAFNDMEAMLRSSQATEYAKQLLKTKVEAFNQRIRQSIEIGRKRHGIYYGPCGNMLPTLPFHDDVDLESNLNNLLSFVNNSYLESMYFISEMSRREEELQELKKIIARFTREIQSQLKIY